MGAEKPELPGGPAYGEEWAMGPLTNEHKETGVRDPEGVFHRFTNGESFLQIGTAGERKPFIRLQSGEEIPFEEWVASQTSSERK